MNDAYGDAVRCVWEVLSEQGMSPKGSSHGQHFTAFSHTEESTDTATATRMVKEGLVSVTDPRVLLRDPCFCSAVRDLLYDALHLGPIAPGKLGQAADWSAGQGAYQFTRRGLAFFRNGEFSLSAPGLLIDRVKDVVSEGRLEPRVVPLVAEAQRCWSMGCLRAATVLIGLASEEVCTCLLDQLSNYKPQPKEGGDTPYPDWEKATTRLFRST